MTITFRDPENKYIKEYPKDVHKGYFFKMLLEKVKGLYKKLDTSTHSCYNVYSDRKEVTEHI